jgi:hypothetical protein
MTPTQRTFTDVESGYNCRLYTSNDANKYHLIFEGQTGIIADGCEVNGFYIAAHTGAEIKLNTGKKIFVNSGQFYNLKEGEKATHRKFIGFSKFVKI